MTEFQKSGDLNKMMRSGEDTILIRVHSLHTGTMVSRKGDSYLAVSLEYSELGSEELKVRTKPVFSKEGNLIVINGPYDENTVYVVSRGYTMGYPVWKKIIPSVVATAA